MAEGYFPGQRPVSQQRKGEVCSGKLLLIVRILKFKSRMLRIEIC